MDWRAQGHAGDFASVRRCTQALGLAPGAEIFKGLQAAKPDTSVQIGFRLTQTRLLGPDETAIMLADLPPELRQIPHRLVFTSLGRI